MFRRVRDLFGQKEVEEIQEIRPEEIPNILSVNEKVWEDNFRQSTSDAREKILEIRDRLILAVQDLSRSEREVAFHPKLEKIAINSLPQFEKALLFALNRQLPDDPDLFYQSCTETLKGCVKGLAGPGRYLRNVLPEEMKEIGMLVDAFGKEMNSLTPLVADWRKKKEGASALREALARTNEMEITLDVLSRNIPSLEAEIADLNLTLNTSTQEKETSEKALVEDQVYQEYLSEAARIEHELGETEREVHSVLSTLTHVIRKAEKITHHTDSEKLSKELNQVTSLLARSEIPTEEEVLKSVTPVLPVIFSMIESGEIQLKNQEERTLFATPDVIPALLSSLMKQREGALEKAGAMKSRIATHPTILQMARIEADQKFLKASIIEKEKRLLDLKEKREELLPEIPTHYARMEQQTSTILGKKIRLSVP